jgi:hypothetical protein
MGKLTLVEDKIYSNEEDQETVTNIAEHNGEQKGERNNSKETRVDFTVLGHTVGVDNILESSSKLVGLVVGWGLLVSLEFVQD